MPWIAAAVIGSTLISGAASYLGGKEQAGAADTAANVSNQQYLQTRQDLTPWRESGVNALGQINSLMGLGGGPGGGGGATAPAAGGNAFAMPQAGQLYPNQSSRGQTPLQDIRAAQAQGTPITDAQWAQAGLPPGGGQAQPQGGAKAFAPPSGPPVSPAAAQENAFAKFRTDPGYEFAFSEGQKALQNSAAARGILNSGATAKALTRFGQGIADQQYGDYFNRLASLSGIGQTTSTQLGQFGANAANAQGNALMQAGNARASAYSGMATSANRGVQNYLFQNAFGNGGGGGGGAPSYPSPYNAFWG